MTFLCNFSGKTVLVVGGSSGIGNGSAQSFRVHGAEVHVCGTRAAASDYASGDGELTGLTYSQLDVTDRDALVAFRHAFAAWTWC